METQIMGIQITEIPTMDMQATMEIPTADMQITMGIPTTEMQTTEIRYIWHRHEDASRHLQDVI